MMVVSERSVELALRKRVIYLLPPKMRPVPSAVLACRLETGPRKLPVASKPGCGV